MDCSTPGLHLPYHVPELAQLHVHWIGDAIQPSHPLSPSSYIHTISQSQKFLITYYLESMCWAGQGPAMVWSTCESTAAWDSWSWSHSYCFFLSKPFQWSSLSYSCCCVALVVSNSVRPHRRQPTRLPRPWDPPGKNTGVGCHFLLQCVKVKTLSHVQL